MNPLIIQGFTLFGAGILTSLTPCVYPMIPISVGYLGAQEKGNKAYARIISFILGQILAFTALGLVAVSLGEVFGFSSELPSVQIGTGLMLIFFAYFSFKGSLPSFLGKWNNLGFLKSSSKFTSNIYLACIQALLVGAISALVASPCTSPVLGGVLTQIAQSGSLLTGGLLMFLYASGLSLLFLLLGLGLVGAKNLPKSGKWLGTVHKVSAVLLLIGGLYFLSKGVRII